MTPVEAIIRREIAQTGPVTVARFMELCLSHPQHGYYATRDPLGAAGDFVTAPEISQMFGEMFGVWIASAWASMGRPRLRLVELGPGRGTLAADALRVLGRAGAAPELWLVETSSALRGHQARAVPGARWATRLAEVPDGPFVLIANEFFDALPLRQFLKTPEGWRERMVGLAPAAAAVVPDTARPATRPDPALAWGLSDPLPGRNSAPVAEWREVSPAVNAVTAEIAERLSRSPGAALIVDYGYRAGDRPPGFTLQALRGHARADPLSAPGETDLTWLIDFDALAQDLGARGATVRVTTQGAFLARMGIGQRAQALARARPDRAGAVADALERLTSAEAMGTLFKAAAAVSPGLPAPPGFAEGE